MKQIDDFIGNAGNGNVSHPEATIFTIKQERAIIKEEHDAFDTIAVSAPINHMEPPARNSVDTMEEMKDQQIKLVEELLKLKSENQGIYFELQQKQKQLDVWSNEILATTAQIDRQAKESQCARDEIECLKHTNAKLMNMVEAERQSTKIEIQDHEKATKTVRTELERVARENKMLSAQLKQIKSYSDENVPPAIHANDAGISKRYEKKPTESVHEDEYDVDRILRHRTRLGKRSFLVQWKNSWVVEENMSCPKILNEYLKANNLKK